MISRLALAAAFAAGLSAAAAAEQPAASEPPPAIMKARGAAKDLGETLKEQLVAAIQADGPVAAIGVCKTIAPDVTSQTATKHGLKIRRTALRVRNPGNAADAFERKTLEDFAAKLAAGADPAKLEYSETVTVDGKQQVRYMKAIPMAAEPCATCHGTELKPDVKAAIDKAYPEDKATGFKPGELRGAFSITMDAPAP